MRMPVLRSLIIVCLVAVVGTVTAVEMRWRVYCDREAGVSFRFPYDYQIPNQYRGALNRPGGGRSVSIAIEGSEELTPEQIRAKLKEAWAHTDNADVRIVTTAIVDLPSGVDGADLEAVFAHLSDGAITSYSAWSYYADDPGRPHANPSYAPEGIVALAGSGPEHSGVLLAFNGRVSALIATGAMDAHHNRAIFETLEVFDQEGREARTWRTAMADKKTVLDHQGRPIKARQGQPSGVSWDQAYEIETPHYHITCTISPGKTYYYGMLMETLYEAYAGVYDPDTTPPFKNEVHVFLDQREFQTMAAKRGFGALGGGVMGFFAPGQLCIYAFDQIPRGIQTTVDSVLAHEASHQFLHVTCNGSGHVPTWINEGLAVYFESGTYRPGRKQWRPPTKRLERLKMYYSRGQRTLWPLENYLSHYGHIPAPSYAEVYAITHFWIFGSKGGKERFKKYWMALKEGEDGTEAFEHIFMDDMIKAQGGRHNAIKAWESALLRYVTRGFAEKVR